MNLKEVSDLTETEARAYLERLRWPNGPACPHCGDMKHYRLPPTAKKGKKGGTREGVIKCAGCRKQYTVTTGTVLHGTHLSIKTWLLAFARLVSCRKSLSALNLQRDLGLGSYQSAWHLAHRIRHAMRAEPLQRLLRGDVEVDEVYLSEHKRTRAGETGRHRTPRPKTKAAIMTIVQRDGELRRQVLENVLHHHMKSTLLDHVDLDARLLTDQHGAYVLVGKAFRAHESVNHSRKEYARPGGIHVNTAESSHALVRRAISGSWHSISVKHLPAYMDELAWSWNHRRNTATEALESVVSLSVGRRLTYSDLTADRTAQGAPG